MTISMIIMIATALGGAILGFFGGHARGKSVGQKEGTEKAEVKQAETQHSAQFEAITQRIDADAKAAADSDDELDARLSKHDRKS